MSFHSLLQRVAATLAVAAFISLSGLAGLSYAHEDGTSEGSSSSSSDVSSASSSSSSSSSSDMSSDDTSSTSEVI